MRRRVPTRPEVIGRPCGWDPFLALDCDGSSIVRPVGPIRSVWCLRLPGMRARHQRVAARGRVSDPVWAVGPF